MKAFMKTIAAALAIATFTAPAFGASLDRVNVKVQGEGTYVPAVRFVSPQTGSVFVTTEDFAKGRTFEGDVMVLPAGTFNPTNYRSSMAWASDNFDTVINDLDRGSIEIAYDEDGDKFIDHTGGNSW